MTVRIPAWQRPHHDLTTAPFANAMAESFFASLEAELIERNSFQSKAQVRVAVFTWIEGWYNTSADIAVWVTSHQ